MLNKKYLFLNLFFLLYYSDAHYESMFRGDNPNIIVDWTPKAGCTAVLRTLLENYGQTPGTITLWKDFFNYRNQHLVTEKLFFDKDYLKVKFVRNPYKRIVSLFLSIARRPDRPNVSFEVFLEHVKNNTFELLTSDTAFAEYLYDHTRKQTKETDQYMNIIIKIEDPKSLKALNEQLHLSLTLSPQGHHLNYQEIAEYYTGDLLFAYSDQYPPYYSFYNAKTLALVEEIYADDIKNFHYFRPQAMLDFIHNTKNQINRPFKSGDYWKIIV